MATTKGSSGVVKLAVSGGSVAAMGEVRSFTLSESADTIEDSVMGDSARTYVSSLTSATLSMEVYWDDADAVQLVMDSGANLIFLHHGYFASVSSLGLSRYLCIPFVLCM